MVLATHSDLGAILDPAAERLFLVDDEGLSRASLCGSAASR